MSMLASRLQEAYRMNPHTPLTAEIGEVLEYDPETNTAQFEMPMRLDKDDKPQPTGFIPVGQLHVGPGYGSQFPPEKGMQALILFMAGDHPVAALFFHNLTDVPPFPDGKTWGYRDKQGSQITTTADGPNPGDGVGAARVHGNAMTQTTTEGGHAITQDDVNKFTKVLSALGHTVTLDDVNKVLQLQTIQGLVHKMDDIEQKISHIAGQVQTVLDAQADKITHLTSTVQSILDGQANEISHVAQKIGLGDLVGNLASQNAAIVKQHLDQFQADLKSARLDDLSKHCAAMVAASVPNAGSVFALIASLADVPVPNGSTTTFIK